MAQIENFIIIHGPNYEEYHLGPFDLEIIPRKAEFIYCDIGCNYDPMVFEVKDIRHVLGAKCYVEAHIAAIDEKLFEDAKSEAGFRWLSKRG